MPLLGVKLTESRDTVCDDTVAVLVTERLGGEAVPEGVGKLGVECVAVNEGDCDRLGVAVSVGWWVELSVEDGVRVGVSVTEV